METFADMFGADWRVWMFALRTVVVVIAWAGILAHVALACSAGIRNARRTR